MVLNIFIKVLVILDFLVCMFIMLYIMIYELYMVSLDVVCCFFEFLCYFVIVVLNIIFVVISVERYIVVCYLFCKMFVDFVNKGIICIVLISCIMVVLVVGIFVVVLYESIKEIYCFYDEFYVSSGEFCYFIYFEMG